MMAIRINKSSKFEDKDILETTSVVHYIPCKIKASRKANVSKYFTPYIKKDDENGNMLRASFRGRPLQGQVVELPPGYQGVVIEEKLKQDGENMDRNAHIIHSFKSLTYWNWDRIPTKNDSFLSALDWIDIAEALHSPVEN